MELHNFLALKSAGSTLTWRRSVGGTIASFSIHRVLLYSLGWLAVCLLFNVIALCQPGDVPFRIFYENKGIGVFEAVIIGFVACAFMSIKQLMVLAILVLKKGRAIWADDENMFYIDAYNLSIYRATKLDNLESVTDFRGNVLRPRGIYIYLSNNEKIYIASWLLAEPIDTILDRLRSVIALARSTQR